MNKRQVSNYRALHRISHRHPKTHEACSYVFSWDRWQMTHKTASKRWLKIKWAHCRQLREKTLRCHSASGQVPVQLTWDRACNVSPLHKQCDTSEKSHWGLSTAIESTLRSIFFSFSAGWWFHSMGLGKSRGRGLPFEETLSDRRQIRLIQQPAGNVESGLWHRSFMFSCSASWLYS